MPRAPVKKKKKAASKKPAKVRTPSRKPEAAPVKPRSKKKASKSIEVIGCSLDEGWRHFEYHSNAQNSHKFWQVKVDGNVMVVRYGRVGSKGKDEVVSFASKADATAQAIKKIREKLKKGYIEE